MSNPLKKFEVDKASNPFIIAVKFEADNASNQIGIMIKRQSFALSKLIYRSFYKNNRIL